MKRRITGLALAFILLLGMFPAAAFADAAKTDKHQFVSGYHDVDFRVGTPAMQLQAMGANSVQAVTVPSSYSSVEAGRIAPIKNQGNDGTCWACSVTSVCEAALNASAGGRTELSTLQLVNFFYNQKYDPLGNATGDRTTNADDTKRQQGGNHAFTMWGLAGWTNGAPESVLPYTEANGKLADNSQIDTKYAYDYDIAHLQNAYIIPYGTSSAYLNNIKQAVMEEGAVACSYYHANGSYNAATGAYYTRTSSSNHAVCIVGWNDSYPSSNFGTYKPSGNGAWLVKNSWGTDWGTDGDASPTNSGMEGYFWISYYDASLSYNGQVYAFDFQPVDNYKYNYQYDGSCGLETYSVTSGGKVGAIYQVKGLSADAERIDAVGLGVYSTNASGTAYIYKNPTAGKPISGEMVASFPFSTTYAGYYTFTVPEAPVVSKGESFSVVFAFNNSASIFVDSSYSNGSWIKFTANTTNDKTYVLSSGNTVTNLAGKGYTARVKAYTNDAAAPAPAVTYTVSYNANGGSGAPAAQTKKEGVALTLSSVVPTRSGYDFAGWATTATAAQAEYQPGGRYTQDADVTLYAVWTEKAPEPPVEKQVNVSVNVKSSTTGKNKKAVTTYTATITPSAAGTTVKTVQYSLDNGATWTTGTSFTSKNAISSFLVKVTDADGEVYNFKYSGGKVTPYEPGPVEKSVNVTASVKSSTSGKGKKKTTVYTATINATATGTSIKTVQYSTNSGSTWTTGTSFTSSTAIQSFLIRVTDADGTVYNYRYSGGTVTAL